MFTCHFDERKQSGRTRRGLAGLAFPGVFKRWNVRGGSTEPTCPDPQFSLSFYLLLLIAMCVNTISKESWGLGALGNRNGGQIVVLERAKTSSFLRVVIR